MSEYQTIIVLDVLCMPGEPPIGKVATPDFDPAESRRDT